MKRKVILVALLTLVLSFGVVWFTQTNHSKAADSTESNIMTIGLNNVANKTNGQYVRKEYKFTPKRTAIYAIFVSPFNIYEKEENIFYEGIYYDSEFIPPCDNYYGYYLEKGKEYTIVLVMNIVDEFDYGIDYCADGYEYLNVTSNKGRIYFDNSKTKWSEVHVWMWDELDANWNKGISGMNAWPGPKASYDADIGKYYYDIPKVPGKRLMVIFNSGIDSKTGAVKQTLDMVCPGGGYELSGTYTIEDSRKYTGKWIKAKSKQTIKASDYTKTFGDKAFNVSASSNLKTAKFTYSTSNANIAAVDANTGKVTIKGAGTSYITIKASGDNTYYATSKKIKVTVKKANQTITASNITKTYSNGATFNVNAKLTKGNGKLSYATSDKKVVTIDSKGKVKIVGNGKVTITITSAATTNYNKAVKKVTITVKPATAKVSSVKSNAKKKITVSWKKDTKVTGYNIQYSTNKNFKSGNKSVTVKGSGTTSKTISGLTSGKTYYVRVRSYKTYGGTNYYGNYSGYKSIKVK